MQVERLHPADSWERFLCLEWRETRVPLFRKLAD